MNSPFKQFVKNHIVSDPFFLRDKMKAAYSGAPINIKLLTDEKTNKVEVVQYYYLIPPGVNIAKSKVPVESEMEKDGKCYKLKLMNVNFDNFTSICCSYLVTSIEEVKKENEEDYLI